MVEDESLMTPTGMNTKYGWMMKILNDEDMIWEIWMLYRYICFITRRRKFIR